MKSMRSLYKKLFHYVPDKRIWAYFSMALSAAAVCSYMGAYWFLWQSIVSILVIPVYEKAMYDAIIVVILMILRGILNIASATCSHYLGFRLETNLRKNGLHKLLDAPIIILDEIAASLDVETEVQIQTGLNHLIQGKTVIVISHRLKSIENADKIVVMKAGTVEACGKHAHLLKQSPTYRKMIEKSNLAEKFNY